MASRAVKAVRFTLAWLVVPAIFAATGYYIIGPRLGKPTETTSTSQTDVPDETPEESEGKNFPPPKIEVSVKKGSTVSPREVTPPRRRKTTPKPRSQDTPTEPAPAAPTAPPSGGGETVPVGGEG